VPEKDFQFRKTKVPSSNSSSSVPIFHFVDPPSDMKRAVLQLDTIGLTEMEKLDGILIDKRHVPQIQNQLLPGCLKGDQLSKLVDIVRCFDPAAKREQNSSILSSPSS
jgi:hypothetical protein